MNDLILAATLSTLAAHLALSQIKSRGTPMLMRLTVLTVLFCVSLRANAQSTEGEASSWRQAFIQVDTTNPPGNEIRAVEFIVNIPEAESIPYQTSESAPGRGNIWARLEGGDEPALILLQHTDVVPADPQYWTTAPPFFRRDQRRFSLGSRHAGYERHRRGD